MQHSERESLVVHLSQFDHEARMTRDECERVLFDATAELNNTPPAHFAFEHMRLHERLSSQSGCKAVEVSHIIVWTNDHFVLGIQMYYISYFESGDRVVTASRPWKAPIGFYSYHQHGRHRTQTLILEEGEYIEDISTRQGEILDQVVFWTSTGRSVAFGGHGGTVMPRIPRGGRNTKIVALFASHSNQGAIHRLGYVAQIFSNWETLKPFLTGRALLEKDRASLNADGSEFEAMQFLMLANQDIFRNCLSFLMPNQE